MAIDVLSGSSMELGVETYISSYVVALDTATETFARLVRTLPHN